MSVGIGHCTGQVFRGSPSLKSAPVPLKCETRSTSLKNWTKRDLQTRVISYENASGSVHIARQLLSPATTDVHCRAQTCLALDDGALQSGIQRGLGRRVQGPRPQWPAERVPLSSWGLCWRLEGCRCGRAMPRDRRCRQHHRCHAKHAPPALRARQGVRACSSPDTAQSYAACTGVQGKQAGAHPHYSTLGWRRAAWDTPAADAGDGAAGASVSWSDLAAGGLHWVLLCLDGASRVALQTTCCDAAVGVGRRPTKAALCIDMEANRRLGRYRYCAGYLQLESHPTGQHPV